MENRIDEYARLLIRVGLNVQPGQGVVISAPVECADFARRCCAAAYDAGCGEVFLSWNDEWCARQKYLRAEDAAFDRVAPWRASLYNEAAAMGYAWLSIYAEDPENLKGVDPDRIRRASVASGKALEPFRKGQMINAFQWCIGSVPTGAWAKKVFPELPEAEAVRRLWEAILDAVRVRDGGDSVQAWQTHIAALKRRVETLNRCAFRYLKYKNALGTDLTVELPEGHFWEGGSEQTLAGLPFCANMPTEEIFTAPHRLGANGVVCASRPLVLNGDIAEDFRFTVRDGKITEIHARRGQKLLETAVSVDEGSAYFGEVALVPYHSPISDSGILFYNTLFDENAACHIAFGDAYPCIEGGSAMTDDQRQAAGLNSSITHEDFMIGTPDLSITGVTKDGREIPIFVNGDFAF